MKTKLLVAAAILLSASSYAQSSNSKNEQGTKVRTEAKAKVEPGNKGQTVSGIASAKSQASVGGKIQTVEARQQRKADREAAREARKQEQKEFVAGVKSNNEARVNERSEDVKLAVEDRKEILIENRERAKAARAEAKADRRQPEDAILKADAKAATRMEKADRKTKKADRPAKVKTGVKADTEVKLRRPKVGAKVQGSAGLGLGL